MPSVNPRLALTLQPHRHDLLKRLAALQGVSMAALVTDMLEEFYPVMERVCVVLEAAKQAQATSKQGLRDAVAQAEAELLPLAKATMSQFDLFLEGVSQSITAPAPAGGGGVVPARAGAAPSSPPVDAKASLKRSQAGANPRVVTRGSGIQPPLPSRPGTAPKKPSRKGASKP